jgi:hypothetical protein
MQKYKENLERDLSEVMGETLEERLKEFFGGKFGITQSSDKLELRKKGKKVAYLALLDEEIHVINKKYENDLRKFRDFYENKYGVDFILIF